MRRRDVLIIAGIVAITLAAALVIYSLQHPRQSESDADRAAAEGLNATLPITPTNADTAGPKLDFLAKVEGEVTTLTVTVSNPTVNLYKDISLDGFTLGKIEYTIEEIIPRRAHQRGFTLIEPREEATLPIKIARLAPGASQDIVLHYDHLQWLGDDVAANRIDTGWAQKPLDVSSSWVAVVNSNAGSTDPNVKVTATDTKGSSNTTGIPIRLDEQDARLLMARRDLAWKARAQRDPFAGDWSWTLEYKPGQIANATANFVRDGDSVSGSVVWGPERNEIESKMTDGRINGAKISFILTDTQDQFVTTYTYRGTSDGDKVTGIVQMSTRKSSGAHILTQLAWNAVRK